MSSYTTKQTAKFINKIEICKNTEFIQSLSFRRTVYLVSSEMKELYPVIINIHKNFGDYYLKLNNYN
jgi:hypothetical protein